MADNEERGDPLERELGRLIKAGWLALPAHPEDYPWLTGITEAYGPAKPRSEAARVRARSMFLDAVDLIDDRLVRSACESVLGLEHSHYAFQDISTRRRNAWQAMRDGEVTSGWVRKHLELPVLIPRLRDALERLSTDGTPRSRGLRRDSARGQKALRDSAERVEHALLEATGLISWQQFAAAERLLLAALPDCLTATRPTDEDVSRCGRVHLLLGHVYRDSGRLSGGQEVPAALTQYRRAAAIAKAAKAGHLWATSWLMHTVVSEMRAGTDAQLGRALRSYKRHSEQELLTSRDRDHAVLWAGSALTKMGRADEVLTPLRGVWRRLNDDSPHVGSHCKLARAELRAGRPAAARKVLLSAAAAGLHVHAPPLQRVRLGVIDAEILLDEDDADGAASLLLALRSTAQQLGLGHQTGTIDSLLAECARR